MTKRCRFLFAIVALEIVFAGSTYFAREHVYRPPSPNLTGYPAYTAKKLLAKVESTRPDVAFDWDTLGDTFMATGFYAEAISCYQRAVDLDQDNTKYLFDLAFCLSSTGRLDAADIQFRKAIDSGYSNAAACNYFIGENALRRGQISKARKAFQASIQLNVSKLQLAELYIEEHDYEKAASLLEHLAEKTPYARRVHYLLGVVSEHRGDRTAAEKHFSNAAVFVKYVSGPWHDRAFEIEKLAVSMRVQTRVAKAIQLIENGFASESLKKSISRENERLWDPSLEDLLARIDTANGNTEAALAKLSKVVERAGASSYRMVRLGFMQQMVEPEAVEETFRTGIRLGNGNGTEVSDMARALAYAFKARGEQRESNAYLAVAEFRDGTRLLDKARWKEAAAAFQRAVDLDEDSARSWFWLGQARKMLGEHQAAIAAFTQCLRLLPHHQRAQRQLRLLKEP